MKDRDDDVDYPTHSGILVMSMSAASYRFRSVSSPPLSNHDLNLSGGFGSLLFVEEEKEEARATSDSIISCPLLAPGVANEQVRESRPRAVLLVGDYASTLGDGSSIHSYPANDRLSPSE